MGVVKTIDVGGEISRNGPDVKSSWSSYNGNSLGVGPTENGHLLKVYNTRNVKEQNGELIAQQQMWQPHNWLRLLEMISDDDPSFRDNMLGDKVTADFDDVAHYSVQHQKLEVTRVADDQGERYEWRLYDHGPGDGQPDWRQQTTVLHFDRTEMDDFVGGVMDGDLRLTAEFDSEVREFLAQEVPRQVAHDVGRAALSLVA